ncbi:delta(14)-sterol reductase LBR isoform X1 [Salmo trutta]|uniref:Delta(14)-sterol reductase LBR n=1 Tax=Salmo trutta TaxID=8032 RepID=A0A674CQW1_SALTR|nr:delta(14)-sterol reductase-like isoform X1 [Salmo trutta]XP_029589415.1 delta(14)-sterol reductase-like isoform X1 [Salmo trutta]XP_029589416.1 delta(14)-sterol reductase-like isoform X1 [Salmo trutta]XP_029589417.1 delta(14)-sterol reductase-like isoform X1 [Salmo trutta]
MRMPSTKFQSGDTVMGRWPGSSLFYEVKVLSYDAKNQLYTVIYKDGTELELREADMKNPTGFKPSRRSRSRSPSRRRSRSRSPARTTRRSSSRTVSSTFIAETHNARKEPKLKEVLEVRLVPVAKPIENNINNKHEKTEENDTANKVNEKPAEMEPEKKVVESRYNLRHRKDDGDAKPAEQTEEVEQKPAVATAPITTELEFGGRLGVFCMTLLLPATVLGLMVVCSQEDASLMSSPPLPALDSLWDLQVFGMVVLWLLFQALLYVLPVGKVVEGMPLKNGERLKYRMNTLYAFVLTVAALGAAVHHKIDLGYIHSHFLQLAVSSLLCSVLLSVYLYVRSRWATQDLLAPGGNSGSVIYDFFMGSELNPRIKGFDLKYFCELRPGLIGWLVINAAMALAEMQLHHLDYPSPAMILVNCFHLLYVLDAFWHEEGVLSYMDITHDGFGFMLAFGDLMWVPFTFSLQAYYLVHHPNHLSLPWIVGIVTLNVIGFSIFRKANSQKNCFRRNPSDPTLSHLKTIPTATGKSLLVSGLWGLVRHPNYLGDLIMALAWSLPCGFTHILPYFYVIYLSILLVHREARDEAQCRRKYGSAWDDYCREVRYRIIPRVY